MMTINAVSKYASRKLKRKLAREERERSMDAEMAAKGMKKIKVGRFEGYVDEQTFLEYQKDTEVWNEERVLATDYYALPVRYRHLQTALYRRGYEVTGKRPQDKDAVV